MWSESSSLSTVNFEEKNYYSSRDIEFFLGVTFLAHPVCYRHRLFGHVIRLHDTL